MSLVDKYTNQALSWLPQVASDAYGQTAGSAPVAFKGRLEQKITIVRNAQGKEVVSNGRVLCAATLTMKPDDQIADAAGRKWKVLSVETSQGLRSTVCQWIYLGG